MELSFGFQHGTSPTICSLAFPGRVTALAGFPFYLFLDYSLWAGYIVSSKYNTDQDITKIEAVDWRDRLHDTHIFAKFNMQESDGRHYHVLPKDWLTQRKTYICRELNQNDFFKFQDLPAGVNLLGRGIANLTLYSAYYLLEQVAILNGFTIYCDELLAKVLKSTYPLNLDWNGGVRIIDAVQTLCDKANANFCCVYMNVIYLSLRGATLSPFAEAFLNGLDVCNLDATEYEIGEEVHDRGRRVVLQGDSNRYEAGYPCRINWNPAWTWDMFFDGVALGALLQSLGLTTQHKVKDLPERFHDYETWLQAPSIAGAGDSPTIRTRMEMTIEEYLDKIAWRCYVVDFGSIITAFGVSETPPFLGKWIRIVRETMTPFIEDPGALDPGGMINEIDLRLYPRYFDWNSPDLNSVWPLASNLVSETNTQSITYATSRMIIKSADYPFYSQHTFIPKTGVNVEPEEVINPLTGAAEWRVRLYFSEPQFMMPTAASDPYDPTFCQADLPIFLVALEKDIYQYAKGKSPGIFRAREQRVQIANLSKAFQFNIEFFDWQEVAILARNYVKNIEGVALPALAPVMADDIAESIASKLLLRNAITKSGTMSFLERAGILPDGIIDSVVVSWGKSGLKETISLSDSLQNTKDVIGPQMARLSFKFMDETELNRKRLIWAWEEAMAFSRKEAIEKGMKADEGMIKAGPFHPMMALKAVGRHGITPVQIHKADFVGGPNIAPGEVVVG